MLARLKKRVVFRKQFVLFSKALVINKRMAADHEQSVGEMEADARMQIQEIIEDLNCEL